MESTTALMACSMTKTITAAAVLQLIEKGKVNLEDSIDKYIENNPYGNAVKVKHLLSQTSGIPDPIPMRWAHPVENHKSFNEEEALEKILKEYPELEFEPGKKYKYSNISYWFLGKIIEKVSCVKYEKYIKKNLFVPLKIPESELGFRIHDTNKNSKGYLAKYSFMNLIKGFVIDKELIGEYEESWLTFNTHYLNGPAFGGLIGSAKGFSKFLMDQLKETSVLFDNKTKDLFYTQYKNNDGDPVEMTYGWHIGNSNGNKYYFKEGGGAGFHCEMRIYPKYKIATVIIVNKTSFNSKKNLNKLDNEFLEKLK